MNVNTSWCQGGKALNPFLHSSQLNLDDQEERLQQHDTPAPLPSGDILTCGNQTSSPSHNESESQSLPCELYAMPEVGQPYSRDDIKEMYGGSARAFLPTHDGCVTCVCIRPNLNPDAPNAILVGEGPIRESSAQTLCEQGGDIPVFVRQAPHEWIYEGRFEIAATFANPADFAEPAAQANRNDVVRLIQLRQAEE